MAQYSPSENKKVDDQSSDLDALKKENQDLTDLANLLENEIRMLKEENEKIKKENRRLIKEVTALKSRSRNPSKKT